MDQAAQEALYQSLIDGLKGIRLSSAPVLLSVRCGIGSGQRRCGRMLGEVVSTPHGPAWVPAVEYERPTYAPEDPILPGIVPILFPSVDIESGLFTALSSRCSGGHSWMLDLAGIKKRAAVKGAAPYYVTRVIARDFGPRLNDPAKWTLLHLQGALDCIELSVAGQWPPAGLSGVKQVEAEGRARVLLDLMQGKGSYLRERPRVVQMLADLQSIPDE